MIRFVLKRTVALDNTRPISSAAAYPYHLSGPFNSFRFNNLCCLFVKFNFCYFSYNLLSKETRFYKKLSGLENSLDQSANAKMAESPFEKMVENSLLEQIKRLRQEASFNYTKMANEKDDLLSWIHEVKTPLTTMQLMLDRIDDEGLKSQLKQEWLRIHLLLDQQLHQKRIHFIEHDLYIEKIQLKDILL